MFTPTNNVPEIPLRLYVQLLSVKNSDRLPELEVSTGRKMCSESEISLDSKQSGTNAFGCVNRLSITFSDLMGIHRGRKMLLFAA